MATKKRTKKAAKKAAKKVVKKTVKKAVKKAAPKKTAKKTGAKPAKKSSRVEIVVRDQIMGEAPSEHYFVLKDGQALKSVQELADALEHMSEDVFRHHVGPMHNDFANWVQDIFDDRMFANDLRRVQNRIETRIKVLQRLVDAVISEAKKGKR